MEILAARVRSTGKRALLVARLRELRDPYLPAVRASSWKMSESHRRLLTLEHEEDVLSAQDASEGRPNSS